ncbi:NUDIX domain-containing protein [Halorussus salilacus]|uniref:NUDIX domain-containing protein n=1 Tax=Halorussus salilacus TaxID=2953750 RepID=UPI00209F94B8|nr:NUDIX domain-containing protein [Halorussus salilacus]USZ66709.1 NUDIX domain-containing protein [Halorussus salilacus]
MTVRPADYCPDCGSATTAREIEERERRYCPSCERVIWQNPAPCAAVAVVDGESVLLVERAVPPGVGEWTIPGGHMEVDEQPEVAAARELREETGVGVDPSALSLVDAELLAPFRGKRAVSIVYAVSFAETEGTPTAGSDAADVRFFAPREVGEEAFSFRPHVPDRVERALDAV